MIDDSLLMALLGKTIEIAKELNLISSKSMIVDATHTTAKYNLKSPIEVLGDASRKLRKLMYQFNEEYVDTFPKKPTNGIIEEHMEYCKKLCRVISKDEKALQLPQISETYNSLVEAVEDNIEVLKIIR